MRQHDSHKKRLIISFDNLTDELKELFAEAYPAPDGYEPYLHKTTKPNGEPIFVVPLETEDTSYMVKFEVKIDSHLAEDELDKDIFGDSSKNGEESDFDIIEQNERGEKDENHREFTLNHGNYEESFAEKAAIEDATEDNAFDTDDTSDTDDDVDDDDMLEPDEEDLLDIELEMMENEELDKKGKGKTKKGTTEKKEKKTKTTSAKSSKKNEEAPVKKEKKTSGTTKAKKDANKETAKKEKGKK